MATIYHLNFCHLKLSSCALKNYVAVLYVFEFCLINIPYVQCGSEQHKFSDSHYTTFLYSGDLKSRQVWILNDWKKVGLHMVQIYMGSEIPKPNQLKSGQIAAILSNHLKTDNQKVWISNGLFSDPHCILNQDTTTMMKVRLWKVLRK